MKKIGGQFTLHQCSRRRRCTGRGYCLLAGCGSAATCSSPVPFVEDHNAEPITLRTSLFLQNLAAGVAARAIDSVIFQQHVQRRADESILGHLCVVFTPELELEVLQRLKLLLGEEKRCFIERLFDKIKARPCARRHGLGWRSCCGRRNLRRSQGLPWRGLEGRNWFCGRRGWYRLSLEEPLVKLSRCCLL